ncbi:MAG: hypothetical protein ACRC67_33315 [Inquilinus sp.]|uniref:hypothetical protein n=1 Tax=Inquilinus sp. TaxID=1932117 RepID=UPI003F2A1D95
MGDKVLMRQAEFARHKGWSRQYVGKLKRTGRLVLDGDQVDVLATEAILAETADPARELPAIGRGEAPAPAAPRDDKGPTFYAARSQREEADAKLKQLDLADRLRTVVARADVEDAFATLGIALRDGLDRRRQALAETVAGLKTVDAIDAALEDADRAMLQRLIDDLRKRLDGPADAAA